MPKPYHTPKSERDEQRGKVADAEQQQAEAEAEAERVDRVAERERRPWDDELVDSD